MSSGRGAVPITELTLTGGERLRVEGDPHDVEAVILSAARGSLMELAWLIEADSRERVGVNPDHLLTLRGVPPQPE
jgi:hypothetical protein